MFSASRTELRMRQNVRAPSMDRKHPDAFCNRSRIFLVCRATLPCFPSLLPCPLSDIYSRLFSIDSGNSLYCYAMAAARRPPAPCTALLVFVRNAFIELRQRLPVLLPFRRPVRAGDGVARRMCASALEVTFPMVMAEDILKTRKNSDRVQSLSAAFRMSISYVR